MKRKKFLMLGGVAVMTLLLGCSKKETADAVPAGTVWTCTMHPQVREDEPGQCPICGMDLVPVAAGTDATKGEHADHETASQQPVEEVKIDEARNSVASVSLAAVTPLVLQRDLSLVGAISYVPDDKVDYTWYHAGRIEKVLIGWNQREVKKGEPLFEMFSEDAIQDQEDYIDTLRARWLATFYERKNYDTKLEAIRAKLHHIGMTDDQINDLEKNKKVVHTFILRAPVTASILNDLPHVGETFEPGQVILHLANLSKVWFVADVYEKDLGYVKEGQAITVTTPARPGQTFNGTCVYIGRQLDAAKRTVKARFIIDNPKLDLLPDLSASGELKVGMGGAQLAVPASAVIDTGRRKVVYVETLAGKYEMREVALGEEGRNPQGVTYVAIKSGLSEGEKIVISGAFLLDAEAQLGGVNGKR
jgi:Cu(I)/Ag(I) efflux system membrane fusion protein